VFGKLGLLFPLFARDFLFLSIIFVYVGFELTEFLIELTMLINNLLFLVFDIFIDFN
jgi:hypothetical protein